MRKYQTGMSVEVVLKKTENSEEKV